MKALWGILVVSAVVCQGIAVFWYFLWRIAFKKWTTENPDEVVEETVVRKKLMIPLKGIFALMILGAVLAILGNILRIIVRY